MRVLVTGHEGFIGKNLLLHLSSREDVDVVTFSRGEDYLSLKSKLSGVDFVFHCAGVNRPEDLNEFLSGNIDLTKVLCRAIQEYADNSGHKISILFASSTQATSNNPYGLSKKGAEEIVLSCGKTPGVTAYIFRLPNVFGKWCRPNYNSVIATFCYNIARGIPVRISDPLSKLTLVYIDDVIQEFLNLMNGVTSAHEQGGFQTIPIQYIATIQDIAGLITSFKNERPQLQIAHVGLGFTRALYATYISYLPVNDFSYSVPQHKDQRGVFVEMLKTPDCGQISYFTAAPGVTRGGHYHHTKTEKFLVAKGRACFKFRHMTNNETYQVIVEWGNPKVVESIPGWVHSITNIGQEELIVLLWANEKFNNETPDTYFSNID